MIHKMFARRKSQRAAMIVALALPLLIAGWVSGAAASPGSSANSTIAPADAADPVHGAAEIDRQG